MINISKLMIVLHILCMIIAFVLLFIVEDELQFIAALVLMILNPLLAIWNVNNIKRLKSNQ